VFAVAGTNLSGFGCFCLSCCWRWQTTSLVLRQLARGVVGFIFSH
jgi:hypothetical protein